MKKTQQLGSGLINLPIFERSSLMPIARIRKLVFRPENLQLAYCEVFRGDETRVTYVRADNLAPLNGWLTVGNEDDFGELDDYIRDHELLTKPCGLFGFRVKDTLGKNLGIVADFSLALPDFRLTRLYVKKPLWQRWRGEQHILPKSHITDVQTDKKLIIVQPLTKPVKQAAAKAIPA